MDIWLCANCSKRSRRGFTPSQQMRQALWVLNQAHGGTDDTFKEFYQEKMKSLIDLIYRKVDEAIKKQTA